VRLPITGRSRGEQAGRAGILARFRLPSAKVEISSGPVLNYAGSTLYLVEAAMRILTMALGAVVSVGTSANAQIIKDLPWNPEHINHLPPEIRGAVLAQCSQRPNAGHYFATSFHDEVRLHYEHLQCDTKAFCNGSQCLHEVYKLSAGHYRLERSFYASGND
jgi:hypothetical protein